MQHSLGKNTTPTTSGQGLLFVSNTTYYSSLLYTEHTSTSTCDLSLGLDDRVYCKCSTEVMRASISEPVSSRPPGTKYRDTCDGCGYLRGRRSNTRLHPLPLTPILKHCLRSIDTPRLVGDQPSCPPDPHLPANTESSDGDEFDFTVPAGASKAAYDEQAMIAGACLER